MCCSAQLSKSSSPLTAIKRYQYQTLAFYMNKLVLRASLVPKNSIHPLTHATRAHVRFSFNLQKTTSRASYNSRRRRRRRPIPGFVTE